MTERYQSNIEITVKLRSNSASCVATSAIQTKVSNVYETLRKSNRLNVTVTWSAVWRKLSHDMWGPARWERSENLGNRISFTLNRGHAVTQSVEALRYNPESHGFDSRSCHWIISLIHSFRPNYGTGVNQPLTETSTRNISWEPQPPGTLRACPDLYWVCFTFALNKGLFRVRTRTSESLELSFSLPLTTLCSDWLSFCYWITSREQTLVSW
jgi:hypothetical protein